ncbi:MAG: hypothetical protein EOP39_04305 [Rubrivivax sp.]|nr:MAG: hypothetical protein EOP39_04305 [Rubrivivax sp.]
MPELIVSRKTVADLFDDAHKEMDRDDAVMHVAGVTGHEPTTIECVLAARESLHTAAMECGA